ncbi:MAG: hypothetical protein ABIK98_04370 [Pseudomonadota bacterium]
MGTIKDLVDLVTQLVNSVEDRKIASELREIQTFALTLQSEQASLHEANIKLREEKIELSDKIGRLERKIEELSEARGNGPSDVPICPNCSTTGRSIYMATVPRDFVEIRNLRDVLK